jgi:hypothetical protein
VRGGAVRSALVRSAAVAGGFTLAALAVEKMPAGPALRATGMLLLPCLLLAVLRREERRLSSAARQARERRVRPRGPEAPAPPRP